MAGIALTLMMGSVQAAHFCDLGSLGVRHEVQAGAAGTFVSTACVVCASSHEAPLARAGLRFYAALLPSEAPAEIANPILSFRQSFALHVRPPPIS